MEPKEPLIEESWTDPMPVRDLSQSSSFSDQPFTVSNWESPLMLDYGERMETSFSKLNQTFGNMSSVPSSSAQNRTGNVEDGLKNHISDNSRNQDWDPRAMLSSLSLLEQKIHQLQELIHMIVERRGQVLGCSDDLVTQQQQLITVDLTSIIVQLISTAGSLLPSVRESLLSANPSIAQIGQLQQNVTDVKPLDQTNQLDPTGNCGTMEQNYNYVDDHESKDEDDPIDEEHLPPGSYEILQLEKEEILAPHTHFCTVCGKGFKRDANLRMHMRGHGDEYKTPAALAKPHIESNSSEPVLPKRYSCPYMGCKRNKDHKKFQPLKTILCVKNHYKRTHCDKTYTCSRCNTKKFSVIADLKTHEKHCGRDKWLCSCGTTFSRKDKLFGHIALFQGHTPAIPLEENKGSAGTSSTPMENGESSNDKVGSVGFGFGSENSNGNGSGIQSIMDMKGNLDDTYFSLLGFDGYNLGGLQEFSQSAFGDSESCFSFMLPGSKNGMQAETSDS